MPEPVNVLYLIRTWALGGSHTIIRLLMHHLPPDRFRVIVVPYDAPGRANHDFVEAAEREGLQVAPERIPWQSRGQWFAALREVDGLVRRYNIRLIHAHDTQSNVMLGLHRGRWRGCAAVASPYGWWEPRWHLQAKAYHWVERNLALPRCDRVITVSEDMKSKILRGRTREERIRVIHTGLDPARFAGGASRTEFRQRHRIPDHAVVVGTVSRLFPEKGHTVLLQAVAQIAGALPQLRVLIVGTGDLLEALREEARKRGIGDRVIFTGFCDDLPGAYRAMDVLAQPSILHEGFPTTLLEAQLMGLPVVASDIGGTRETLHPGETGLLVTPGNAGDLAGALRRIITETALRRRLAANAQPFIAAHFTREGMIAQVVQTYEEALAMATHP